MGADYTSTTTGPSVQLPTSSNIHLSTPCINCNDRHELDYDINAQYVCSPSPFFIFVPISPRLWPSRSYVLPICRATVLRPLTPRFCAERDFDWTTSSLLFHCTTMFLAFFFGVCVCWVLLFSWHLTSLSNILLMVFSSQTLFATYSIHQHINAGG